MPRKEDATRPEFVPNLLDLIRDFKSQGFQLSKAVERIYDIALQSGETLPCTPITTKADLARFLKGRCQYRYYRQNSDGKYEYSSKPLDGSDDRDLASQYPDSYTFDTTNVNNYYSTNGAFFLVVHPPSEAQTSNGHTNFVSLAHHNFTAYSDLYGPVLSVPCPKNTVKIKSGKPTVPFVPVTIFDNDYAFLDRSGLNDTVLIKDNDDTIGFVDELYNDPHRINVNQESIMRVFVPLDKDKKTIAPGWQVYALPNQPQKSNVPFSALLQNNDNQSKNSVHAAYVSMETGNVIFDKYFYLIWKLSTFAVMASFTAFGVYNQPVDKTIIEKAVEIGKYAAVGFVAGGLTWPVITFLWAMKEDSNYPHN